MVVQLVFRPGRQSTLLTQQLPPSSSERCMAAMIGNS
jgi:hypothetical protein